MRIQGRTKGLEAVQGVSGLPRGYRVLGPRRRGGTAVALDVVHERSGRRCVAKLLPDAVGASGAVAARLKYEARVLRRLRHPNIVRVLDWGILDQGYPYLVLEYLPGRTLLEEVRARRVSLPEAVEWTRQLLRALAAVHGAGLLHRDVTPDNIILAEGDGKRVLKICDFGFATVIPGHDPGMAPEHRTEEFAVLGSPHYLSPEAVRADPLDARADLYQAGLVLYTLLTGYVPFSELDDTGAVLDARLYTELPPAGGLRGESIPESLEGVVSKALASAPAHRFACAQEFIAALDHVDLNINPTPNPDPQPGVDRLVSEPSNARDAANTSGASNSAAAESSERELRPAIARWLAGIRKGSKPAR